ncbi:MAG: hypothetical protein KDK23_11010 [Leptospiraceae bacterium]|nr:hypothetical protein [Leptospiraceae bacterium]
MRRRFYTASGSALILAVLLRLVFCPADLCARSPSVFGPADNPSQPSKMEGQQQPCHGEKSAPQSDERDAKSCCHDETSPDVPNGVALPMPEMESVRLPLELFSPESVGQICLRNTPEPNRPPGPALYLKISRLLN